MKIGVISDTHGSLHFFNMAMEILSDCDRILHAGDILYHGPRNDLPGGYNPKGLVEAINSMDNIYFAKGNCDSDVDQMVINHPIQSPGAFVEFNERKIYVTHGYLESTMSTIFRAKEAKADILILGHTHIKGVERDENLIILNPGSTALPKDGIRSCAIITDTELQLINIESKDLIISLPLEKP